MKLELGIADGQESRTDHGEILGPASGHDRVDGRVPGADPAIAYRLVEEHLIGRPRPAGEHALHERSRGRHHGQAIGPLLREAGLDGLPGICHIEAGMLGRGEQVGDPTDTSSAT